MCTLSEARGAAWAHAVDRFCCGKTYAESPPPRSRAAEPRRVSPAALGSGLVGLQPAFELVVLPEAPPGLPLRAHIDAAPCNSSPLWRPVFLKNLSTLIIDLAVLQHFAVVTCLPQHFAAVTYLPQHFALGTCLTNLFLGALSSEP